MCRSSSSNCTGESAPLSPKDWVSLHIFYAADSNPLLTDCVGPLIAQLRDARLIDRWFFIRYWLEGPHVRLRLLPSTGAVADEVRHVAREALGQFLSRRPALWEPETEDAADMYKSMFLAEYTQEEWNARYGASDRMIFQPNNSVQEIAYEPEFNRYGGPDGIEPAERHFERSSDTVIRLLGTTNAHVRPVLLGLSIQLMLVLARAFLESDEAVGRFFLRYRLSWESRYDSPSDIHHARFDQSLSQSRGGLLDRIDEIKAAISGQSRSDDFRTGWVEHAVELRSRIEDLTNRGRLAFGDDRQEIADPSVVLQILLTSYVHMTNNRLGVLIQDEIYLSYVISKVLGVDQVVAEPAGLSAHG
jgi:thiopeptide-type bacteriocin biosynthesis protein